MRNPFLELTGERLGVDAYYPDFDQNFRKMGDPGFWKLERQQYFKEPGYDSWEAFARGDWLESLRIIEAGRTALRQYHNELAERGLRARRVRVVEEPITPYLQWEMHALKVRNECGGLIRVVDARRVTEYEGLGPLPEAYTLGADVMYVAMYDVHGVIESALRVSDKDVVGRCQDFIESLFEIGEPLSSFFAKHVENLPSPRSELG